MKRNKKKDRKSRFLIPRKLKYAFIIIISIILLGVIGYGAILIGGSMVVDDENLILDQTTTIETMDGELIGTIFNENRVYVSIEKIPEHVLNAYIAIEDRSFYEHAGIDMKSVTRAALKNILAMSKVEGASTITQQLSKNLFLYNDKTWTRKAKEAMAAVYLEKNLTKSEILELYLNEIYFGHGVYGIQTASNYFFSKSVSELNIAEGALLAGMAKAPNGYSPINHPEKALNRRNLVLQAMEDAGMIQVETKLVEQGKTLGLNVKEIVARPWVDSYIDLVTKEAAEKYHLSIGELKRGGYRVVVGMNVDGQEIVYELFQDDSYFPGNTEGVEGAFVMMDQQSGRIIAAHGARDYHLGNLNRVTVNRQPGSTFKPIAVYGPAMMQKDSYTAYTLLPDSQMDKYMVSNVDGVYENYVSLYDALTKSKNTSAVWLLDQIGVGYAKDYLTKMGIEIEDESLAIALGGLKYGVSPLKMMESYRSFISGGKVVESYTIDQIYNQNNELVFRAEISETEVFSPQLAWNMTEILSENVERGTAQVGEYNKALAGKTGSTQHPYVDGQVKDAWFVGYTPEYVAALWMGYDKSDKDHYLTGGSSYPTALTKAILTEIDKVHSLAEDFTKPDNVEDLPKPIELPKITELQAEYTFGGLSLIRGKLTWNGSSDERVIYRIYREQEGIDKRIAEARGKTEYTIDNVLFLGNKYYIVAYDPLTKLEGERSKTVELSW